MFQLAGALFLAIFTIPLVLVDVRERRLPNRITLPAGVIALLGVALAGDLGKTLTALVATVIVFALGTLLSMRNWIGMGDVKLLLPITLILGWYGWQSLAIGLGVSFVLAGVVVLVRFIMQKITASSTIALGPYLLIGFWVCVIPLAWSSTTR